MVNQLIAQESREFKRYRRRLWMFLITRVLIMVIPIVATTAFAWDGHTIWAFIGAILSLVVVMKTLAACVCVATYLSSINLYYRGDYAALRRTYLRLLQSLRNSGNSRAPSYAQTLALYGGTLAELGDGEAAVKSCQEGLDLLEKAQQKTLPIYRNAFQPHLGSASMHLAKALFANGEYQKSLEHAGKAIEIFKSQKVRETHYRWSVWPLTIAAADNVLLRHFDAADAELDEALRLLESELAPGPMGPRVQQQSRVFCYASLALLNYEKGSIEAAETYAKKVLSEWQLDPKCSSLLARTMMRELRERDAGNHKLHLDKLDELVGIDKQTS